MLKRFSYGNEVRRFVPCDAPVQPADDPNTPITWAKVLAKHGDDYVLLFNYNRQQWETPGGGMESGETLYETAVREVMEETCQVVTNLVHRGLFKLWLADTQRSEYGALYTGEIETLLPFIVNNESDKICLWQVGDELEGKISELSLFLIELIEGQS